MLKVESSLENGGWKLAGKAALRWHDVTAANSRRFERRNLGGSEAVIRAELEGLGEDVCERRWRERTRSSECCRGRLRGIEESEGGTEVTSFERQPGS